MAVNKFLLAAGASVFLGGCAAVNTAIVELENKVSSTSTPRINEVSPGLKLTGSDRPKYTDLYEMEARYSGGLVRLPNIQQVLDNTLMQVATEAGYPDFDGKIHIVGDPNDLHAQASREGNIFISLGFLRNIDSQEELTNLVAHEFAHIALQHHRSDVFKDMNSRLVTALNAVAKLQTVANAMGEKGVGIQNQKLAEAAAVVEKARFVQDLVAQVASPTWGRQQELAADQFAADISSRLNHRYNKSTLWLAKLARISDSGNAEAIRVNRVNLRYLQQFQVSEKTAKDESKGFGERAEGIATQIAYGSIVKVIEYFSNSHSDSKVRSRLAKQYYTKLYPEAEPQPLPTDAWARVKQSKDFEETINAYLLADEAVELASTPKTRKAAAAVMAKAEKLRGNGHVYIWARKVDMYEVLNQEKNMQASLKAAPTAGLQALTPRPASRDRLNNLLAASLPAGLAAAIPASAAPTEQANPERLAEIQTLRNELALPVFGENNRRLPNVRMLLNQADYLLATGQRDKAYALQKEVFETYQRPGFIYPKLIMTVGSDPNATFARLEAEKLNLECGFLHPEQAGVCDNALMMSGKGKS